MNQAPPKDRRPEERVNVPDQPEEDSGGLKEAVETAASAYFSACRKIARAINRLKKG